MRLLTAGIILPALLSLAGFVMAFSMAGIKQTIGLLIMFGGGLLGTFQMCMLKLLTPSAFAIFDAKLRKKTLLFVWFENGAVKPLTGNFESGWIWLKKRLGYLVSSPEDKGYLDGVPIFIAYRGVGKTLNPKVFADITLLEKYGIDYDYLVKRIQRTGVIPQFDISDEGEIVERDYGIKEVEVDEIAR